MKTILVTDDDRKVLKVLSLMLEKEGYSVLTAGTGAECMEMFHRHAPELVITDIVMPDTDGITLIKALKHADRQVKVIAISGGAVFIADSYLKEAKLAGADFILPKPVRKQMLLQTMANALNP